MSNNHISDDLPLLLTGDATRDVVIEAAAHLRTCVDCQQELVSAVVAHASLMSAHRFAPEIVASDHDLVEETDDPAEPAALPDLSGVFAEARADATVVPIGRFRGRRALIGVAAAAAIVVGGGVTVASLQSGDSGPSVRNVALTAFDRGHVPASVKIVGNSHLKINASKLPKLGPNQQYEVWLTSDDRKRMQPIGFIGSNNKADLPIPSKVSLSNYNAIEVSVQRADEATYSGISVVRGTYG